MSYDLLYFCGVSVTSPFSFLILLIWIFCPFFFIDESSLRFISFVYLPKELLVSLIFDIVFFVTISFTLCSSLNDFIPSANFGFICSSFSISLRHMLSFFIGDFFFIYWDKILFLYTFPFFFPVSKRTVSAASHRFLYCYIFIVICF